VLLLGYSAAVTDRFVSPLLVNVSGSAVFRARFASSSFSSWRHVVVCYGGSQIRTWPMFMLTLGRIQPPWRCCVARLVTNPASPFMVRKSSIKSRLSLCRKVERAALWLQLLRRVANRCVNSNGQNPCGSLWRR